MAIQRYRPQPSTSGDSGWERTPSSPSDHTEASWAADLVHYFGVLRRRWWLVLLPGLLGLGVAWWQQRDRVPTYTAEALLQQSESAPVLGEGILGASGSDFGTQVEVVRSRAVLAPVVDSLGLQLNLRQRAGDRSHLFSSIVVDPEAPGRTYSLESSDGGFVLRRTESGEIVATSESADSVAGPGFRLAVANPGALVEPVIFRVRSQEQAVGSLQSGIRVEQGKGRDLLWVRYTHPDPQLAAGIVNSVARSYQHYRAERAREAAGQRRRVIADQLVQLSDSLENVQERVLEYQRNIEVTNPDVESSALISAQLRVENELRSLRFEERMLSGLAERLNSGDPTDATLEQLAAAAGLVPAAPSLVERLRDLQTERSRLTASRFGYTENQPQVQVLDSLIANTKANLQAAAQASLDVLRSRISGTQSQLAQLRSEAGAVPQRAAEYGRLEERVDAVKQAYDRLVEQYYQAQVAEGVEQGDIAVVDPATVPLSPDPERGPLKLAIALMAGLMIGAVGAVAFDFLDASIRDVLDAEQAAQVEVIGTIPKISLTSGADIRARIGKESFRAIRTNLRFLPSETPGVLAVTSAEPGEGKSMVAANLALTLVEQGSTVLLIDADLRRSQVHRIFGSEGTPGLSELLRQEVEVEAAVRSHQKYRGFDFLPGGEAGGAASELLGSDRFVELLEGFEARYDFVIIDTPPVLAFTDATLVGVLAEGTLVVARANRTDRGALEDAVERLRRVGTNIVGVVLNDLPLKQNKYYTYYDDYYSDRKGESTRRPLLERAAGS